MISGRELFAEISNEAISEDGEAVGYFVKNSRMELLERLLTAPPAPAVPDEATAENVEALSGYVSTYKMTESERDIAAEVWNACRAAMLAQPVSGGYKLASGCQWTYDEMDFKWDSSCGESWQFIDGGPSENGVKFCQGCGKPVLLAAEPEGGNDHDTRR
ncbi:hypothetical protein C3468_16140 [Serratia marcescens]|uniref:hypothetical protein n=1 Tax=Serratia marcescens TaxID=615 RepID=UPI000CDDBF4C|nr:hypothetical protein C3468_16140 [Serratia marcescens]